MRAKLFVGKRSVGSVILAVACYGEKQYCRRFLFSFLSQHTKAFCPQLIEKDEKIQPPPPAASLR